MAEVSINIHGRVFGIACDDGQEARVQELATYIDDKLRSIAQSGAGSNESHLLVLTSLVMADELFDLKAGASNSNAGALDGIRVTEEDEGAIIDSIEQMASRIDSIAGRLQKI